MPNELQKEKTDGIQGALLTDRSHAIRLHGRRVLSMRGEHEVWSHSKWIDKVAARNLGVPVQAPGKLLLQRAPRAGVHTLTQRALFTDLSGNQTMQQSSCVNRMEANITRKGMNFLYAN
jgi:hypothetical protein